MLDEKRETWTNQIDFFLSALGYAVGFGAVWRFPYLTYENGGGAFLIPYILMFLLIGLPVFFIEMTLGQYSSSGPVRVYQNICPLLGGTGIGMVINSFIIMLYYNMIVAWTLYYMYTIFANIIRIITAKMRNQSASHIYLLDWSYCNPEWSSPNCVDLRQLNQCRQFSRHSHNGTWGNETMSHEEMLFTAQCNNISAFAVTSTTENPLLNASALVNSTMNATAILKRVSPSEDFFYRNMLESGTTIDDWSWPVPQMLTTLFCAWVIAFLCLVRGLKQAGKIVWVTSTFPYVILIVLLIRGAFLPGAGEGIRYFIQPALKHLADYNAWVQAAGMILFLLSVGGGGLSTYASYNPFHNNIYRDSLLIPILDLMSSFLGGFCVFAYIGFIALMLDVPVPDTVTQGTAVLFIALPEATTQMPASVVWALGICLMMLMLGMDTQFAFVETCMTAVMDEWPSARKHKTLGLFLMCSFGLILGLVFTLKSGLFWLNLVDNYVGGWPSIFFSLCETVVILIYSPTRLSENLEAMTGKTFGYVYRAMWWFFTPVILLVLLILSCLAQPPLKDENDVLYPEWSQIVGWTLALSNVAIVPLYAIYAILTKHRDKNLWQRCKILIRPTAGWDELDARAKQMDIRKVGKNGGIVGPGGDPGPGDMVLENAEGRPPATTTGASSYSLQTLGGGGGSSGYGGSVEAPVLLGSSLDPMNMNDDMQIHHRRHSAFPGGYGGDTQTQHHYRVNESFPIGGSAHNVSHMTTSVDVNHRQ